MQRRMAGQFVASTNNLLLHEYGNIIKNAEFRASILNDIPKIIEQIKDEENIGDTSKLWVEKLPTKANSTFNFTSDINMFPLPVQFEIVKLALDVKTPDLPVELYNDQTLSLLLRYLPGLSERLQTQNTNEQLLLDHFLQPEQTYRINLDDYVAIEATKRALKIIKNKYKPLIANIENKNNEFAKQIAALTSTLDGLNKKLEHKKAQIGEINAKLNEENEKSRRREFYAESSDLITENERKIEQTRREIEAASKTLTAYEMMRAKIFKDFAKYETKIVQRLIQLLATRTKERKNRGKVVPREVARFETTENDKIQPTGYAKEATRNFTRERQAALNDFSL